MGWRRRSHAFYSGVILPSPTTSLGRWVFDHFAVFPCAGLGGYLSRRWNRGTWPHDLLDRCVAR